MNGYPCCCTCEQATDDFNRSAIGSDWTQRAGTWSISANKLTTSSDNGLAIWSTQHPDGANNTHIQFAATAANAGGAVRGIVGADDTLSNYLYAEWIFGASCTTLKFVKVATGSPSQLGVTRTLPAATPGTMYAFEVCYKKDSYPATAGEIVAVMTNGGEVIKYREEVTTAVSGDQIGLGTGSLASGSATFDDFAWNDHKDTKGSCDDCKGGPCEIIDETFDGTLDCNWDEAAGSWSVSGGKVSTSDASARLLSYRENVNPGNDYVRIEFEGASGDEVSVLVDYKSATENHRVTVTIGDEDTAELRIYKGATLLKTDDVGSASTTEANYLKVCVTGNLIEAEVGRVSDSHISLDAQVATTLYGGAGMAIGTQTAAGTLEFLGVVWSRGASEEDPGCPHCIETASCLFCVDNDAPMEYKITLSGMAPGTGPNSSTAPQVVNWWEAAEGYNHTSCSDLDGNTDCTDFNGTFILSRTNVVDGVPLPYSTACVWFPPLSDGSMAGPGWDFCESTQPGGCHSDFHGFGGHNCATHSEPVFFWLQIFESHTGGAGGIGGHGGPGRMLAQSGQPIGPTCVYFVIQPNGAGWNSSGVTDGHCHHDFWLIFRACLTTPLDCMTLHDLELPLWKTSYEWWTPDFTAIPGLPSCIEPFPCDHSGLSVKVTAI